MFKDHAVFVLRDGQKVLFVQRSKNKKTLPNIWAFPSGTVEEGEKPEETARREAKEELGVEIEVAGTLATVELQEFPVRLHFIVGTIKSGELEIKQPEEIQVLCWLTFQEFFAEHTDQEIGHGLIWLRQHPEVWRAQFSV